MSATPETAAPRLVDQLGDAGELAQLAATHYENFPVGSWLLPKHTRVHVHRLYAFARAADDIADEKRDLALLQAYRRTFLTAVDDPSACPVPMFADLSRSIHELDLPVDQCLALLDAFEQDLNVGRYDDDAALLDYCERSANPVGRLVLRIFGHRDPQWDAWSDQICTALQLVNHLQDLASDLAERDRVYFPQQDFARFGTSVDELRASSASPHLRQLIGYWTDRSAAMLRAGWPLCRAVPGRLRHELRAIVHGAAAVIGRLRATGHDPLGGRTHLTKAEQLRALSRALLGGGRLPKQLRPERAGAGPKVQA